jgi:hypothetical protein
MMVGQKVLKLKSQTTERSSPMSKVGGLLAKWDEVHTAIGAWLIRSVKHKLDPEPLGTGYTATITKLNKVGAGIPPDYKGRRKWWLAREYNRAKVADVGSVCKMSDAKALGNRKQFVRQFMKPHSTTNISHLDENGTILRTPDEIEGGLHAFLTRLGGEPESRKDYDWSRYIPAKGLLEIMDPVETHELRELLSDLDSTSAAGELPAALVKLTGTGKYERSERKTPKEIEREKRHEQEGNRHQPGALDDNGSPIEREHDINPDKQVTIRPQGAVLLLKYIVNHSLLARTIPRKEKRTTVTGLPKGEGQVTSTTKLRPISVGPVIGTSNEKTPHHGPSTICIHARA